MSDQENRKRKLYAFATIGAHTEGGGCVTSGCEVRIGSLPLAYVSDIVTYDDGSQAVIVDGARIRDKEGQPLANVRYRVLNGGEVLATGVTDSAGYMQRIKTNDARRLT